MMYDLAIIGAGSAGIACAKLAARLKLKTVLFETNVHNFGGTCLNSGCIPTKFFISSARFQKSWQATVAEKNDIVRKIKEPLLQFLSKSGIEIQWGEVSFHDEHTLTLTGKNFQAKNIIIASGSLARKILEGRNVILAEELFDKEDIGEKFLIVGAGYIGIEIASLLNSFGKDVTLIEIEDKILPNFDEGLSARLHVLLERRGISIHTAKSAADFNCDEFNSVVISAGRAPNTQPLSLDKSGVASDERGWIKTDTYTRTTCNNIYACGDVSGRRLFAYTAEYEAQLALKNIMGKKEKGDYSTVPECVFSSPQLARVGITEEEAKERNSRYKVIKSNFLKFSSAYVYDDKDGFIQLIVDQKDRIRGAGIISNFAAELINIFSLAIKNNLTTKDFKKSLFIHPTLSEIIGLLLRE